MEQTTTAKYRKCKRCGRILPIEEFRKNGSCRGGYEPTCKTCKGSGEFVRPCRKSSMDIDLSSLSIDVLLSEIRSRGYTGELRYQKVITL